MKGKLALIILAVLCVGLAVALVIRIKQSNEQQKEADSKILYNSNQWAQASYSLSEQKQVNQLLEKDLNERRQELASVSNNLIQTAETLSKTESQLKATREEVARRDEKISQLETENQALDKQALELSGAITNLNLQIEQTQQKLAATEGDKAFLEQELQRLMVEKAELERQFNDLAVLKAQVKRLKEELSIARRIEWLKQGLLGTASEVRGAQKLMQLGAPTSSPDSKPKPSYDLNVEISEDGTVRVIPSGTNAPAQNSP